MAQRWILRRGSKSRGFRYETASGQPVRNEEHLERIRKLAIPPAWRDVHIAAGARAAVQAWGYDAKGRKQYRYHPRAAEIGQKRKYYRVRRMGHDLPAIRKRVDADWRARDPGREKVAAAVVRLLGLGYFRIGSERYTKENRSFGLVTLRRKHVSVEGECIRFEYKGKSQKEQRQVVHDRELAAFVRQLLEAPGSRVFRYRDETGRWADLTARDVNEYLRAAVGVPYTAKDFRTWGGTLRLATVLADLGPAARAREAEKNVVLAIRLVAAELGNTPAICRKSYVHPIVIAKYLDEGLTIAEDLRRSSPARGRYAHAPEERALLRFLDRHFPERRRKPRDERDDEAPRQAA